MSCDIFFNCAQLLLIFSLCIEGDASPLSSPSPAPSSHRAVSSAKPSRPPPHQTIPMSTSSPSRFQRLRPASAAAAPLAFVTPSAFDKGGRARVHALARAAAAAEEKGSPVKTLRPLSAGCRERESTATPGSMRPQQQRQQRLVASRLSTPSRQQRAAAATPQNKQKVQKQQQQQRQKQQMQKHERKPTHEEEEEEYEEEEEQLQKSRGRRLCDQDDIVSPREASGSDDVSAAAAAAVVAHS